MPRVAKFNTVKKDLSSFPFKLIEEAFNVGFDAEEAQNKSRYLDFIRKKEKEWADTHEAPYEGNFEEEFPYTRVDVASRFAAGFKSVDPTLKELNITYHASWLLPQLSAWLNKNVLLIKNDSGKYDAVKTFKDIPRAYKILATHPRRGTIVKTQCSIEGLPYSSLVPLLLEPFKKFRGVAYSEWDVESLRYYVHAPLYEAMTLEAVPRVSTERALELRNIGLSYADSSEVRKASSTHKLYHLTGTEWEGIPDLAGVMLAQIWVASPHTRLSTMVLDPEDWDALPDPLIPDKVFKDLRPSAAQSVTVLNEW